MYKWQSYQKVGNQPFQNPPHHRTVIPSTKGPNFAITPKYPPVEAYITAVEKAASKLPSTEADELRSDTSSLLRCHIHQHNNHSNINPAQCRALTQLKQDTSMVVLTADKGVAMVIMDQQDYINKVNTLLQDTNTYRVLNKDPTTSLKNKLISTLRNMKQTGALSNTKYRQLYPTSVIPPKFYGLPKIHKAGTPLRPIVSSRGSITYGVAKELAHIIKPLVGQSHHYLKNTQHFIQQIQGKRLNEGRSSPPLMSRLSSHQYQWHHQSKQSNKNYNMTQLYHKELTCPFNKSQHFWSSASPTLTPSSRVSIMNKSKVQLWDPPSAPSYLTSLWKSLR